MNWGTTACSLYLVTLSYYASDDNNNNIYIYIYIYIGKTIFQRMQKKTKK